MWTIEKVKDELPDVRCRFGDKVYLCRVKGRKNQFATVYAIDAQYLGTSFTWEAITNSLNFNFILVA